jgi:hypothetical protein
LTSEVGGPETRLAQRRVPVIDQCRHPHIIRCRRPLLEPESNL